MEENKDLEPEKTTKSENLDSSKSSSKKPTITRKVNPVRLTKPVSLTKINEPTESAVEKVVENKIVEPTESAVEKVVENKIVEPTEPAVEKVVENKIVEPTEPAVEKVVENKIVEPTEPAVEKVEAPTEVLSTKKHRNVKKTVEKVVEKTEKPKPIKKQPLPPKEPVKQIVPQKSDEPKKYRKLVKWMWRLAIAGVVGLIALFTLLSYGDLPSFEELENPKSKLATNIYAADGKILGRYFVENRVPISFNELSPKIVAALIATEDLRYYQHSGIDARGLARAIAYVGTKGGASTITQQLAKLLYTDHHAKTKRERFAQKLKEWITSAKLERSYTKDEIMAMYLNKFSFINGAYGIKAASETYFGKDQKDLTQDEAAVLVGMLQNPSLYNPLKHPVRVQKRRNVVLSQMVKYDKLSKAEYEKLKDIPINMTKFSRSNHTEGPAPYFRMEMSKDVNRILKEKAIKKADGSSYDIYKDGLKVYTTIDPVMQKYAEESVEKKMAALQKKFWKVWKDDDPWTYIDPEKMDKATREGKEIDTEMLLNIRKKSLHKLVTQSKRYSKLKGKYLSKIVSQIESEHKGLVLKDYDIERMVKEAKESGYLKKLLSAKLASASKVKLYRKIMKSDSWITLLAQAKKMEAEAKKTFSRKVKMKVFAYNDKMEKDTVMTPIDSIRYHRMILQVGLLAVEPSTGFVKAWVGGVNHKYFKFDHVRIDRQVGSTFKPFVYSTAILLQGVSPCFQVMDVPQTISPGEGSFHLERDWTPRNANNKYTGESLTLKEGLRKSKNTVSVFLMKQLGSPMPVINLVDNMGISKKARRSNGRYRIPRSPSICLGAVDLQVWEMAGAYTTFANNGVAVKPVTITKIEDKNGKLLYEYMPEERSALPANVNYVMMEMLKYNLVGARGFGKIKSQVGGKTGTTNGYSDGWFMGVTPNLIVGTWVGGEDHWIHFKTISNGAGSKMARPIFVDMLTKLEKNKDIYDVHAQFKRPSGEIGIELDCTKYKNSSGNGNEYYDDVESQNDSIQGNDGLPENPFEDEEDEL